MTHEDVSPKSPDADVLLPLLLFPKSWVHRRVETITILDNARVRHHISIDFTIDADGLGDLNRLPVPLTLMRKQLPAREAGSERWNRLVGFSLTDETGASLPLLTRQEGAEVSAQVLALVIGAYVRRNEPQRTLTPADMSLIRQLIDSETEPAQVTLQQLRDSRLIPAAGVSASSDQHFVSSSQEEMLAVDSYAEALATDFASSYLLLTPLHRHQLGRRITKFVYEDEFHPPTRKRHAPATFPLMLSNIGSASSYHFQIVAPSDVIFDPPSDVGFYAPEGGGEVEVDIDADRLSVYCHSVGRGGYLLIDLRFKPDPNGFARIATYVSLSVFVILGAGLLARVFFNARPLGEAVPAVLVALPGVYAAYGIRADEHKLTSLVMREPRTAVMLSAGISFVAAASLALDWGGRVGIAGPLPHWRMWLWLLLLVVMVVIFAEAAFRSEGWWSPLAAKMSRLYRTVVGVQIKVDPRRVRTGSRVTVSGAGFEPLETVNLRLKKRGVQEFDADLGSVQVDGDGRFVRTVGIPAGMADGKLCVLASGIASGRLAWKGIRIT